MRPFFMGQEIARNIAECGGQNADFALLPALWYTLIYQET